ncbi:unnamed protein product [Allacma fusca]|uniref:Peptidase S1 domain-containing protein n=1 Tax=Allacma fusca TaxID=39272 RepID=A0A8J2PC57_9HEXA|nr:unnamed protein product [Allacma fusca]
MKYLVYGTILSQLLDLTCILALPGPEESTSEVKFHGLKAMSKDEVMSENEANNRTRKFPRIVGGTEVKRHKFPSIVAMNIYGSQKCGGTILAEEWVVSAGHCVISRNPKYFEFLAGKHNIAEKEDTEQRREVVEVIPHEDYDPDILKNDIALFKVSPKFEFNEFVQPANVPKEKWNTFSGMSIASGWGRTSSGGASSDVLLEAEIPLMTLKSCREKYPREEIFNDNICAGYEEGGKDACQGDSGGPLYFKDKDVFYQIGVTSWGIGCARPDQPGVYTDISQFLDWIKATQAKYKSPGQTGGADVLNEGKPKRTLMATVMAQTICSQFDVSVQKKTLPKPIRNKPDSSIKCGYFKWTECSGKSCGPFKLYSCKK